MHHVPFHDHRGQGAASHAGHAFQAVLPVGGGLSLLKAQAPTKGIEDDSPQIDGAGRSHAHLDLVPSRRCEAKLIVEGSDAVDPRRRNVQERGHGDHGLPVQVSQLPLYGLKQGDEAALLHRVAPSGQQRLHALEYIGIRKGVFGIRDGAFGIRDGACGFTMLRGLAQSRCSWIFRNTSEDLLAFAPQVQPLWNKNNVHCSHKAHTKLSQGLSPDPQLCFFRPADRRQSDQSAAEALTASRAFPIPRPCTWSGIYSDFWALCIGCIRRIGSDRISDSRPRRGDPGGGSRSDRVTWHLPCESVAGSI